MKRLLLSTLVLLTAVTARADGWPAGYGGVMLQGFYWDSFVATQWTRLESQADELAAYFDLIWVPQSGNCNQSSNSMGYLPYYFWDQNSSFGTESELRSMIAAFKERGLGTIADVVVNHHNTEGWFTFPAETYNGVTYQLLSTDIVADDDSGATATQAAAEGVALSSNNDEGEGWDGCRDLDHKSSNVQTIIKAYLDYLANDLGYTGFRYDMVKGFAASHIADYNAAAGVEFSVGEYWDSNSLIESWIGNTGRTSAAFDFQFRYNVRDAINNNNWSKLNSVNNLMHDANYRQWAVTFVENHDTEYRSASEQQDPIVADTLAANAYLLAMPGTPCVFLKHWTAHKRELKQMINCRKALGITNTSTYEAVGSTSNTKSYAVSVAGSKGNLLCVVGSGAADRTFDESEWVKLCEGYHYVYYASANSGITAEDIAEEEEEEAFEPYTISVYVNADDAGSAWADAWSTATNSYINYWTWNDTGNHAPANSSWPGDKITATTTRDGKTFFKKSYTIESADDYVCFVFSVGTGTPQTVDVQGITSTKYYEISSEKSSTNYRVSDVTEQYINSIEIVENEQLPADNCSYNLSGQRVGNAYRGVVIRNGRKVLTF